MEYSHMRWGREWSRFAKRMIARAVARRVWARDPRIWLKRTCARSEVRVVARVSSWRMLMKVGSLKSHTHSLRKTASRTVRTWLAIDGLLFKIFFAFSSLDSLNKLRVKLLLRLITLKFQKIYFGQGWVNARSASNKLWRILSSSLNASGSFATCSTMESSSSTGRWESGGVSMMAKRKKGDTCNLEHQ